MSLIFGVISKKGIPVVIPDLNKAMEELCHGQPDSSNHWSKGKIGFGNHFIKTTPESIEELLPFYDENLKLAITADVRLDYREQLIIELSDDIDGLLALPDSQLLIKSYAKWGENCINYLYGDFAFAIWDETKNILFCARDHLGCRPFYYFDHPEFFIFSSNENVFGSISEFSFVIEDRYIFDSICLILPDKDVGAFKKVKRLEPAFSMRLLSDGEIHMRRYWDLMIIKKYSNLNEDQAIEGLRTRFIEAVRQRCRTITPIGAELSGGIDSSSIVSCMTKLNEIKQYSLHAFTHAVAPDQLNIPLGYVDEMSFCRQVIKLEKSIRHHIITGEKLNGSFSPLVSAMKIFSKPISLNFTMMSDLLYEKVNEVGARILLSGFGGDEGVTSHAAGYFEELAIQNKLGLLKQELRKKIEIKGNGIFYKLLFKYYILAISPWLYRKLVTRRSSEKKWHEWHFNHFAFNNTMASLKILKKRYFEKSFLLKDHSIRLRQYKRLNKTNVSVRLENSYIWAQEYNIEYRYPFLDVKLIEFYYSLSSELKYRNGIGRYIFRKAMEGILPESIRMRDDKAGATIPNMNYRLMKDESIFREIIEEGRNNNHTHYVDYDKIIKMLDNLRITQGGHDFEFSPTAIFNPICVLLLQKWQREGKIDIGIKC